MQVKYKKPRSEWSNECKRKQMLGFNIHSVKHYNMPRSTIRKLDQEITERERHKHCKQLSNNYSQFLMQFGCAINPKSSILTSKNSKD